MVTVSSAQFLQIFSRCRVRSGNKMGHTGHLGTVCFCSHTFSPHTEPHFHPASLSRAANSPGRTTDLEAVVVTASAVDEVCPRAHSHCTPRTTSRHGEAQWTHQETETPWVRLKHRVDSAPDAAQGNAPGAANHYTSMPLPRIPSDPLPEPHVVPHCLSQLQGS